MTRISAFMGTLLITLALLIPISIVGADNNEVSAKNAIEAAEYYNYTYPSLPDAGNTIVKKTPITYYTIDNQPIAYEFTILDQESSKPLGYIIISATQKLMPLLERGSGPAPSSYINKINYTYKLSEKPNDTTIYYLGGMAYYIKLPPQIITR